MTTDEVKKLKPGDQVFWNDPDDGICSRYITINRIEINSPNSENSVVTITGNDGYLECFASELS